MHICSFTDFADLTIEAGGQSFRFEFSRRFGPAMLGKRGDIIAWVPAKRSPFWKALQAWCDQGHQVADGRCVFELPREPVYVTLVGKHVVEVPEGCDPQAVRREWFDRMGLPMPEEGMSDGEASGFQKGTT
jgi:hypothetical protein